MAKAIKKKFPLAESQFAQVYVDLPLSLSSRPPLFFPNRT